MNVHASNLDIEKFRKVHALMTGGATAGERAAAKNRAEAIAAKAGMTVKQAASKLSAWRSKTRNHTSAADMAREWADRHEREQAARQEAELAKWEAYHAKEARKREDRFAEAVRKYGPAEQAFAETDREKELRLRLEPFATYRKFSTTDELYIDGYIGWRDNSPNPMGFESLMDKIMPLPASLAGLVAEWKEWDALFELRFAYDRDYDTPPHVESRRDILERRIARTPVTGWGDMEIRLAWMREELNRDRFTTRADDIAAIDILKADFAFLRDLGGNLDELHSAQSGHRTTSQKREAVMSMLDSSPELSSREIARRVGVSPQTVASLRKRRHGRHAA